MVAAIDNLINAVTGFKKSSDRIVLDLVKGKEAEILDLNTDDQLLKGLDSDGQVIGPSYRPLTISIKRAKGQPTDRVTLKDTGDFHASFFIAYGGKSFAIGAKDEKTEKLESKYGPEIFGLSDKSLQELIDMIRDPLCDKFRKSVLG